MPLTKDAVLKRKADLEAQRTQLISNVNAISGAIQDCDYWAELIDKKENELFDAAVPPPVDETVPTT